eukprot:COSAG04_NODE_10542_length_770_cov_0.773472_1_plen_104_part_10
MVRSPRSCSRCSWNQYVLGFSVMAEPDAPLKCSRETPPPAPMRVVRLPTTTPVLPSSYCPGENRTSPPLPRESMALWIALESSLSSLMSAPACCLGLEWTGRKP